MKTKEQLAKIALLVSDDVVSVKCSYAKTNTKQTYTFICMKDFATQLEKDDIVIAQANDKLGYQIVKVISVDQECDIDTDTEYNYCWIIEKVDTETSDLINEKQNEIVDKLYTAQRRNMQKATLEALGMNTDVSFAIEDHSIVDKPDVNIELQLDEDFLNGEK